MRRITPWASHPAKFDAKALLDEKLTDRINYALIARYYHVDPGRLTFREYITLCEGVRWNSRFERGEEPIPWIERNSVPGSIRVLTSPDVFFSRYSGK